MVASVRSNPWPLVALVLGIVLAYDLGARTRAPAMGGGVMTHFSRQIDVTESPQQILPGLVPEGMVFVLRDVLLANTQANSKNSLNVGANVYPSLFNGFGATAELKLAGTNLRDWAKGNNNSNFGGGRNGKKGNTRSQTGLVGLTGGVVFGPGTTVVMKNYIGPLFFTGELLPVN